MSHKRCKTETLLIQTTNRKSCMAYLTAPFRMTLSDLQGHNQKQGFSNATLLTAVQ